MEINPFNELDLQVDSVHTIKIKQFGNSDGKPIILLHGGPGSGKNEKLLSLFDLKKWNVVLFDQRGSGESTPKATLENNTTSHLVSDIELIRKELDLNSFVLMGGSWGSTLALAYAIEYPEVVRSLILRGIFLGRKKDIDWLYGKNAHRTNPERWELYDSLVPEKTEDYVKYYYDKILSGNEKYALAWARLEAMNLGDHVRQEQIDRFMCESLAVTLSRIEAHYFVNQCFMGENYLLGACDKLQSKRVSIIHGTNDMVCGVNQALELAKRLPKAKLIILEGAGHAAMDPQIYQAEQDEICNHF